MSNVMNQSMNLPNVSCGFDIELLIALQGRLRGFCINIPRSRRMKRLRPPRSEFVLPDVNQSSGCGCPSRSIHREPGSDTETTQHEESVARFLMSKFYSKIVRSISVVINGNAMPCSVLP